ncbi:MAG: division plane positioning ATPase MipZ [Kiloniellales bacterium]|nr:division plane positioning ATPase MipZ [Kiloniellales bacterium]
MTPRPRPHIARPHVIVLGNEKGGSGKSTTALHLTVALLNRGFSVGCLDLDARQGTLSRYLENRAAYLRDKELDLPMPELRSVPRSQAASREESEAEEARDFGVARAEIGPVDYLVIDTPGSDSFLSRLGHSHADTLITPLNDSFLDLDLLARIEPGGKRVAAPSVYSQMVWEQRQERARRGGMPIDWVVMRNRLTHIDSRSKRAIADLLAAMGKRFHFRVVAGFGERVIFRELFLKGLTLLDLREEDSGVPLSLSHVAARQEVRALLQTIGLPDEFDQEQNAAASLAGAVVAGQ